MSIEAMGENGAVLGSDGYWSRVNQATFFGRLMQRPAETNYQETLYAVGGRANTAVEEIYTDLQEHLESVRAISSDYRSALAKQVQSLYDVCRMSGSSCSHSSECIGILNLSSFYLPSSSFSDERAIQDAIQKIKNCSDFFASECLDLIQKAADWSISFAAGSDARKAAFLKDITQGKGKDFLRAVLNTYRSNNESADLRGRCGYSIGSRDYLNYMERAVFLQDVPFAYSDDYDGALKNSLENIAHQLQRDLSRNERENNYITDDTARTLRAAVSELDRCGISTGISDSSIGRLAWFVGGDAAKIRQMQRNLNNLGVGQRLEEDGVYGEKTKEAIDNLITKISSYLSDPQKMRLLDQAVGAIVSALDFASGPHNSSVRRVYDALEKSRQELQRVVWKLGAEYYLRARGYNVAALLLEHSLESSPSNLYFGQTHWVTQKIMQSNGFQKSYADLEQNIQSNPEQYAVSGKMDMNFQTTGDTDLFYGIGKCTIYYTCKRRSSTVQIEFTVEDEYDFDRIRSISGDVERVVRFNFSLGNLANDAGLFSQADGVISPYRISANFEKSIEMKGVYL